MLIGIGLVLGEAKRIAQAFPQGTSPSVHPCFPHTTKPPPLPAPNVLPNAPPDSLPRRILRIVAFDSGMKTRASSFTYCAKAYTSPLCGF